MNTVPTTATNAMEMEIASAAMKHQITGSWTRNHQGANLFRDILTIMSLKVFLVLMDAPPVII